MIEIIPALIVCVLLVQLYVHRNRKKEKRAPKLVLLMGPGGHTGEMCKLLNNFRFEDTGNIYVISPANNKNLSENYFIKYIQSSRPDIPLSKFIFLKAKKTNQVNQSKITAVFTSMLAFIDCFFTVVMKARDATHIIGNGPGFCVPFFYIYFLLNKMKITDSKLIFVESWCRVDSLSASGKFVRYVADEFLINWQKQKKLLKSARYQGQLI